MSKVLILGGGYAGMLTAAHLEKLGEPFMLLNKYDYHYMSTLLHEAAGGRSKPNDYAIAIKDVLTSPHSELVVDEVAKIDRDNKKVYGKNGEWSYDYLVITLGWIPEYFGIQGLAENSLVIRNLESASHIHEHIVEQFKEFTKDGDVRHLRIVVGGAGLTGIELVGELLDFLPKLAKDLNIDYSLVDLQCIEAMPMILPQVAESLRNVAFKTLTHKGAKLRIGTKILKVEPGVVHVEGDVPVESGTIIWTGGVRANPLLQESGFTCDRRGRAKVNQYLQSVDDENIFIGGDTAWFEEEEGKPLPPTAQVATQMGPCLAHNVSAFMHGREMQSFHASLKGTLASLGREVGVGDLGGIPVRGMVAGLAKEASKVKYLLELGGLRLAADKTGQVVHL